MRRAVHSKQDQSYRNSPGFLIASGFEQFGQQAMYHATSNRKSSYDDQEMRATEQSPKKREDAGNLFVWLMNQLTWHRT